MGRTYKIDTKVLGHIKKRAINGIVLCRRCKRALVNGDWVHSKSKQAPLHSQKCKANRGMAMPPKIYHLECAREVHLV